MSISRTTSLPLLVRYLNQLFSSHDFYSSGDNQAQVSHPPHLKSNWSSALIPFCAYKTQLNFSEEVPTLEGTNYPLCSSFLPTILEGQLCYKLAMKKPSGQGKENELMLLLDYNEDRSLQVSSNKEDNTGSANWTLNFGTAVKSIEGTSAKVVINTLSPYTGFGGGIYKMTDVKRMTAKEDFLKMPLKDRNCEMELYEDCRTRRLMETCNCVPWELTGSQVNLLIEVPLKRLFQQGMETCSPEGRGCIEENSSQSFNCNTTCVGIYADVDWVKKDIEVEANEEKTDKTTKAELEGKIDEDLKKMFLFLENKVKLLENKMQMDIGEVMKMATGKRGDELDKEKYKMLVSEYRKFKTKNVKHFRFNAAANLSEFGESCLSSDKYE